MRLAGRTAIITGAGSGIGRASAVLFAKEGAYVALVDRDRAGLQETLTAIDGVKGEASVHVGDVSEADFAPTAVGDIMTRRARLDVLMTAAGADDGSRRLGRGVPHQCRRHLALVARGDARDAAAGQWLDHHARLATRDRGRQEQQRLYRRQGCDYQPDPDDGAGFRNRWNPRQCDRARCHRHADAAAQFCSPR